MKTTLLALIFLVASTTPVFAQMKQWTDEKGVTHFSNEPRQPTELEELAKPPGEQQVSVDGLLAAKIVRRAGPQLWFSVRIISVSIGPVFDKLSNESKNDALWTVLRYYQKSEGANSITSRVVVYDAKDKNVIGSYSVGDGFRLSK
jgi:hypothetical protein